MMDEGIVVNMLVCATYRTSVEGHLTVCVSKIHVTEIACQTIKERDAIVADRAIAPYFDIHIGKS